MTILKNLAPRGDKASLLFASCALKLFLALAATLLPLKSLSVSALETDTSEAGSPASDSSSVAESPPSSLDDTSESLACKDGYEYVEAVGKCYKKCAEGWERNSETLRCRKIRTEESTEDATPSSVSEPASKSASDAPASSSGTPTSATSSPPKTSTSSAPLSCKDGYEYVESVGKCYKKCIEGYERNPETNRCKKATVESNYETDQGSSGSKSTSSSKSSKTSSEEKSTSCKEGYEYVESAGKCYKACSEGQIRNPETNRCKKAETSKETTEKECEEGYERNPETNRCRKIKNNDGADYDIKVPNTGGEETTSFIAIGGIIAIVLAGAAFVIFQYRAEIQNFLKKHFKKPQSPES